MPRLTCPHRLWMPNRLRFSRPCETPFAVSRIRTKQSVPDSDPLAPTCRIWASTGCIRAARSAATLTLRSPPCSPTWTSTVLQPRQEPRLRFPSQLECLLPRSPTKAPGTLMQGTSWTRPSGWCLMVSATTTAHGWRCSTPGQRSRTPMVSGLPTTGRFIRAARTRRSMPRPSPMQAGPSRW